MAPKKRATDAAPSVLSPPPTSCQPLTGCVLVFTSRAPASLKEDVITAGAQITSGVSGATTHVLVPKQFYTPSKKCGQAQDKSLPIVTYDWAQDSIRLQSKQPEASYQAAPEQGQSSVSPAPDSPSASKKRKASLSPSDDSLSPPSHSSGSNQRSSPTNPQTTLKKIVKKGNVPVDECGSAFSSSHHVLEQDGSSFEFMLNQTNIAKNANKFYVAQILESDVGKGHSLYLCIRYGRVGESGQKKQTLYHSKDSATNAFLALFRSKTGIAWSQRETADPKPGKYTFIPRDVDDAADESDAGAGDDEDDEDEPDGAIAGPLSTPSLSPKKKQKTKAPPPESQLPLAVQNLAKLIFSEKVMSQTLSEMHYDSTKLPLGKLTAKTIEAGYTQLSRLDKLLDEPGIQYSDSRLVELTSTYYTLIPHSFPRKQVPPVISNKGMVKMESEFIDALRQMADSLKFKKNDSGQEGEGSAKHQLDSIVEGLRLKTIEPVPEGTKEHKTLEKYCLDTQGDTHRWFQYTVQDIFRVEREGDDEKFAPHLKVEPDNRQLLWHGSRVSNFGGILGQGLRIAPPEAPVSGWMFGKGVYLANMSSKSVQYCNATSSDGTGLLLLCEAQLGDPLRLQHADYNAKALAEASAKHSTHGLGRTAPESLGDAEKLLGRTDMHGVKIPQGNIKDSKTATGALQYDEHIVYSESQLRLRYLLRINVNMTTSFY